MNPFDALTWVVNGLLAVICVVFDRIFILLLELPLAYLLGRAPGEQRPWITASGTLALLAAGFVPPPVLLLLTVLAWAGALAVKLDRFNPKALRWRASGGIALYAIAALGFSGYAAYASRIDANAWASVVSGGDCRAGARLPEHAGGLGAVGDPARRIPCAPAAGHLCSPAHTGVTSGDDPRRARPGLPGGRCWWLVHWVPRGLGRQPYLGVISPIFPCAAPSAAPSAGGAPGTCACLGRAMCRAMCRT